VADGVWVKVDVGSGVLDGVEVLVAVGEWVAVGRGVSDDVAV
jgi:hypothetical protein